MHVVTVHRELDLALIPNEMEVRSIIPLGLIFTVFCSVNTDYKTTKNFEELYKDTLNAYSEESWKQCADSVTDAIESYRIYLREKETCRMKCKYEELPQDEDDGVYSVISKIFARSVCMEKCREDRISIVDIYLEVEDEIIEAFQTFLTHDYLQICSFKVGNKRLNYTIIETLKT